MSSEKILIVDDDKFVRDTFKASFDEYKIITASSGEEALNTLQKPHNINLIIVDMMMPGMTGIELVRKIKSRDPEQKVILLTGYSSKDVLLEALRSDVDEYLEKPFDIKSTKKAIDRLLNKKDEFDQKEIDNKNAKLAQAERFITKNYNKSITLKDVSNEVFLSPKYFSRMFKERRGIGFASYRTELKIDLAKDLLERTHFSIAQIAFKVGYKNSPSFMKIFKRATSLTPTEFRIRRRYERKRRKI
ncbi:MAG: DNA-binding response regulator [Candidatus Omnitrophota bacterium]